MEKLQKHMVELYTMQRYLQYNTLRKHNLQHFDAWASTFGETITAMGNSASIPLDDLCERFIKQHKDIANKLKNIDLLEVKTYLTDRQFDELKDRIDKAVEWAYKN